MSLAVGSPPSFQIPTGEAPGIPGMSDFAGAIPGAVQPVTLGAPVGATPVSLPPLVPMTPGSDATDSSVGGTTPGGTHVCLRHDKHQAKKKCTCGKARRYKQQSRGYKPPAPDAEFEELRRDGILPVVAALAAHAGDAAVAHWGCLALGNVCYSRKNADAVKAAGGEAHVRAIRAAQRDADGVVARAADRALELLNRDVYRDEEVKPTTRGSPRSPRSPPALPASPEIAAHAMTLKTSPSAVHVGYAADGGYTTVVQAPPYVLPAPEEASV